MSARLASLARRWLTSADFAPGEAAVAQRLLSLLEIHYAHYYTVEGNTDAAEDSCWTGRPSTVHQIWTSVSYLGISVEGRIEVA